MKKRAPGVAHGPVTDQTPEVDFVHRRGQLSKTLRNGILSIDASERDWRYECERYSQSLCRDSR